MPLEGPQPQPGDLIEFKRTLYQHWGVYVGEGNVVHLTDQEGVSSWAAALGGLVLVREDPIEVVANGCSYRVNNKYDKKRTPYPPEKIVNSARSEVGKKRKYHVVNANCEHFVTELRYHTAFSDQADDAKMYAATGGLILVDAIGAIAASLEKDKQKE